MNIFKRCLVVGTALLALVPTGCRRQPDPAAEWTARCLAAHGGEAALRKVRTLVWQGAIAAIGNRQGRSTILLKRPGQLRTLLNYGNAVEDRILDAGRGWRNAGSGFVAVTGPPLTAMRFQYRHLTLPLGLLDPGVTVTWAGSGQGEGLHPRLRVARSGEPDLLVGLDPQNGLIRRVAVELQIGTQKTELAVVYSDYSKVEGVQVPTTIVNFAGGMEIARSRFSRVAVNSRLPAKTFAPSPPDAMGGSSGDGAAGDH